MSTVSRRPRVKSISSAALDAAAVACVAAVGSVVSSAIRALDAASRAAWAESSQKLPSRNVPAILPVSSIRAQMPVVWDGIRRELDQRNLPAVESAKLAALMALQVAPYACEPAMLQAPMEALIEAGTESEVAQASRRLQQAAETGHQQVVVAALTAACRNASVQAGLPCVDTTRGLDGSIRVVATDETGRALVTEIHAGAEQEPSIETEVVGVTDGSCTSIMDRFDQALEQQGVRTGPADRKWTGGVCELAVARQFIEKLKPAAKPNTQQRRRTRLNQSPGIRLS